MPAVASGLPDIDGEACVHALAPNATCRACVDACPMQAWILGDDGLGLDTGRCDGCGLCVPACPRHAIDLTRPLTVLHDHAGQGTAWLACELAPETGVARMCCVHAVGVADLDRLAMDKVRLIHLLTGDCSACARAAGPSRLQDALALHGRLRESRGLAAIVIQADGARAFGRSLARALEDHEEVDRGRRRLFRPFLTAEAAPPPGACEALALHTPVISAERCVTCDACIRICPDGALAVRRGVNPAYLMMPERCTGCGLCADVCDLSAIRVDTPGSAKMAELSLDAGRCKACGVVYYRVSGTAPGGSGYCRICARTNHHKNLFQVFGDE